MAVTRNWKLKKIREKDQHIWNWRCDEDKSSKVTALNFITNDNLFEKKFDILIINNLVVYHKSCILIGYVTIGLFSDNPLVEEWLTIVLDLSYWSIPHGLPVLFAPYVERLMILKITFQNNVQYIIHITSNILARW